MSLYGGKVSTDSTLWVVSVVSSLDVGVLMSFREHFMNILSCSGYGWEGGFK